MQNIIDAAIAPDHQTLKLKANSAKINAGQSSDGVKKNLIKNLPLQPMPIAIDEMANTMDCASLTILGENGTNLAKCLKIFNLCKIIPANSIQLNEIVVLTFDSACSFLSSRRSPFGILFSKTLGAICLFTRFCKFG